MKKSRRYLRSFEILLWIVGISCVGVALGSTFKRWSYQTEVAEQFAPPPSTSASAPLPLSSPVNVAPETAPELPRIEAIEKEIEELPAVVAEKIKPSSPEKADERRDATEKPKALVLPRKIDPLAIARIDIPRLHLRAVIREGDDDDTLDRAVGLVPGTSKPGGGGNVVLAAHRDTLFRPLRNIRVGDEIRITDSSVTRRYRVDAKRIVEPTETSVMQPTSSEQLTLITCYPFRWIGPAPQRFVVTATPVE